MKMPRRLLPLLLDEAQVRDRRRRCRADAPRRRSPCRNRQGSIAGRLPARSRRARHSSRFRRDRRAGRKRVRRWGKSSDQNLVVPAEGSALSCRKLGNKDRPHRSVPVPQALFSCRRPKRSSPSKMPFFSPDGQSNASPPARCPPPAPARAGEWLRTDRTGSGAPRDARLKMCGRSSRQAREAYLHRVSRWPYRCKAACRIGRARRRDRRR